MKKMNAKFAGKCSNCGGSISKGSSILWSKPTGAMHDGCGAKAPAPSTSGCWDIDDYHEARSEAWAARQDEREYSAGYAQAGRYLSDKAIYGEALAEQWELESEMRSLDW